VCPASLKLNWESEIKKFTGGKQPMQVIAGGRNGDSMHVGKNDIVIINYDILDTSKIKMHRKQELNGEYVYYLGHKNMFWTGPNHKPNFPSWTTDVRYAHKAKMKVMKEYRSQQAMELSWMGEVIRNNFKAMIIDESHYIKNSDAIRTQAVLKMGENIEKVVAMSGTPIVNRPIEMYNTLKLINSRLFPSFWKYAQRYCGAQHNGYGWDFTGASNTKELHEILVNSIMVRRLKEDVLPDLPEKQRSVIPIEIDNRNEYNYAEEELISWIADNFGQEKADSAQRAEALVRFEKLKQLVFEGKFDGVKDWIGNYLETGEKLVVFTTHKESVTRLKKEWGTSAVVLDGNTPPKKRKEVVDRFQNESGIRLFIGNIKAAGVGITLTAASATCFVEFGWTPGDHSQAEDRVHRIGQKSDSVNAYYLIGDRTIEVEIAELIDEKRKVLDSILDGKEADIDSLLTELLRKYNRR